MNLLDNTANQASKFTTKKWVKISDDSSGTEATIVKLSVRLQLKWSLCYYSDAHILVYRTIATTGDAGPPAERTQT